LPAQHGDISLAAAATHLLTTLIEAVYVDYDADDDDEVGSSKSQNRS
jgi:hypothetical protein